MQILAAIDDENRLEEIVRLGTIIQQMTGGTLTLLAVIDNENKRLEAEAHLVQAQKFIESGPSQMQTRIRVGQPFEEILAEVTGGTYDLLVVSERPKSGLLQRFIKPTAERLVTHIDCPVLLSRGPSRPLHRVLVCESGREPTILSGLLTQMSALFSQIDDLTVLHVMSQIAAGPGIAGWELRADATELIQKQTPEGSLLEEDLARLDQVDIEPKAKVRHGLVVEEILAEAQSGDYDLVVIGAHPGEGWERFLLDDLAREIISQVARPLLVMKR